MGVHQIGLAELGSSISTREDKSDGNAPCPTPIEHETLPVGQNFPGDTAPAAEVAIFVGVHAGVVEAQVESGRPACEFLHLSADARQIFLGGV